MADETDEQIVHNALRKVSPLAPAIWADVAVQALRERGRLKGSVELSRPPAERPADAWTPKAGSPGLGAKFMSLPLTDRLQILEHMGCKLKDSTKQDPNTNAARGDILLQLKAIRDRGETGRLESLVDAWRTGTAPVLGMFKSSDDVAPLEIPGSRTDGPEASIAFWTDPEETAAAMVKIRAELLQKESVRIRYGSKVVELRRTSIDPLRAECTDPDLKFSVDWSEDA